MGNSLPKNDLSKLSGEENYFQIFSKDPGFEAYYLSNRMFFSRSYQEGFSPLEGEHINNDCLGCHYLKRRKTTRNLNWLTYLKAQCEEINKKSGWSKEVLGFLNGIEERNFDYFVKKYIIDIYYIDYKSRIFDNMHFEDQEARITLKKNQSVQRTNSNFNNAHETEENEEDFMIFKEKNPTYTKHVFTHYAENMTKIIDGQSPRNLNTSKSFIRNLTFLQNNTMISQNKICDLDVVDTSAVIEKAQFILHENSLNHYKMVTHEIEKHLKDWKSHPLAIVKQIFLRDFFNQLKNDEKSMRNFDQAILNTQQIIRILAETILLFYNFAEYRKYLKRYYFFSRENMLSFMTCIIFTEKTIYHSLMTYQMMKEAVIEQNIEKAIRKCSQWTPEDFGISRKYTLTEKTVEYYSVLKKKKGHCPKKSASFENFEISNKKDAEIVSFDRLESYDDKSDIIDTETIKLGQNAIPYRVCIENLRKMHNLKAPVHKLKAISKVYRGVVESIREFYRQINEKFEENCIEPDEVISIFMYLVTKAHISGLYSECVLMERFLTAQVLSTVAAYHLTHLKAALYLLAKSDESYPQTPQKND